MISAPKTQLVGWGLLLVGAAIAPAPEVQEARKPSPLAEARYNAALKQFNLIWSYYQQSKAGSFDVYVWSRLLLDAKRAISAKPNPADRRIRGASGPDEEARGAGQESPPAWLWPIERRGRLRVLPDRG